MDKQKSQIKIGMILNYLSMGIEGIVIFFLNPFIIRSLGQENYGVYTLMSSFTGYLSVFEFGLGTTIIRYISKYNAEKDEKTKENFLSMCFGIYTFITAIMIIVAIVLYNNIGNFFANSLTEEQIILAKRMFVIIATSMTITTLGSVFSAIISGYEKFIFSRGLILVTAILNVLLTILVIITNPTAVTLTYVTLIITLVTIISNMIYVFYKLKVKIKYHGWDKKFFREIFSFSIFIFIQTLINQIYWRLDQLIIGVQMANAAISLAIYAVAMKVNDLILAFTTVINRYQLPTITRLVLVEKENKKLTDYLGKTSKFVTILYIAIIIGFIFFGKKFINIYAGEGYELAYNVVLIVIISAALSRIHGCGSDVLKAKNLHGIYTIIVFATAIINILLTILLIPKWGIIGAAIGTAISVILGNTIAYYWCLHVKAGINIRELFKITFDGFIPVILIASCLCIILNYFIGDSLVNYIIKLSIFGVAYLMLVYKYVLDEETKERLKNKILKRR